MKFLRDLAGDETGATAIEYGLIAALIAVAAIASMQNVSKQLSIALLVIKIKMNLVRLANNPLAKPKSYSPLQLHDGD